jgi:integrase/recombinase XerC
MAKATFAFAIRRGLIHRSPVDGLSGAEIPSQRNAKRVAVLDAEQLGALVESASTPRSRALLGCAAYAGLRLGEIRALRWRDVDTASGVLSVRASDAPGRDDQTDEDARRSAT